MGLYIKRSKMMLVLTALVIIGLFAVVLTKRATWPEVGVLFGMWVLPSLFGKKEKDESPS